MPKIDANLKAFNAIGMMLSLLILITVITSSHSAVFNAASSEELLSVLLKVTSGDEIELQPVEFRGSFTLEKKSNAKSITISGTTSNSTNKGTTFCPPSGSGGSKAFIVDGSSWTIRDLAIQGFTVAIDIKGNDVQIKSVVIRNCVNGIQIDGNETRVLSTVVDGATEGMIISGQRFQLKSNVITANKTTLNVQSSVKSGTLQMNTLFGPVIISGNNVKLSSNVAKECVLIDGGDNQFSMNVFNNVNMTKDSNDDDGGNTFTYVDGSKQLQSKFAGRFANFMSSKSKKQ